MAIKSLNKGRDTSLALQKQVQSALVKQTPLLIKGSGSKDFYGREVNGDPIELSSHKGIIHYQATELVLCARAGTPLQEIEACLQEQGQILSCEPPHFF